MTSSRRGLRLSIVSNHYRIRIKGAAALLRTRVKLVVDIIDLCIDNFGFIYVIIIKKNISLHAELEHYFVPELVLVRVLRPGSLHP